LTTLFEDGQAVVVGPDFGDSNFRIAFLPKKAVFPSSDIATKALIPFGSNEVSAPFLAPGGEAGLQHSSLNTALQLRPAAGPI
jgi:hypothetical protein